MKVCPKCGSTDVGSKGFKVIGDVCNDCGYGRLQKGIIRFPDIDEDQVESFKEYLRQDSEGS